MLGEHWSPYLRSLDATCYPSACPTSAPFPPSSPPPCFSISDSASSSTPPLRSRSPVSSLQNSAWTLPHLPCPSVHPLILLRSSLRLRSALRSPATITDSEASLAAFPTDFFLTDCCPTLVWLPLTSFPRSRCLRARPARPVWLVVLVSGGCWGASW